MMLLYLPTVLYCQVTAITQYGDKVVLFDDFTWNYADEENLNPKIQIRNIEIDTMGMVKIVFSSAGNSIVFYDGKIFSNDIQNTQFRYHNNDFFKKSIGKIKELITDTEVLTFDYHENFIFRKSEGKIKRITMNAGNLDFDYHENSFFPKSEGKVRQITFGSANITFDYFENSIYHNTEGKLKEIRGKIPGINVQYVE